MLANGNCLGVDFASCDYAQDDARRWRGDVPLVDPATARMMTRAVGEAMSRFWILRLAQDDARRWRGDVPLVDPATACRMTRAAGEVMSRLWILRLRAG